jgi:hypothetical protein
MVVSDKDGRRRTASRMLFGIAMTLMVLALVIAVTGGGAIRPFGVRLSARGTLRPTLLAWLLAAVAFRLLSPGERDAAAERWSSALKPRLRWTAPIGAAMVLALGLAYGTRAAGGSDTYGYVSEARLWASGSLHIRQDVAATVPWPNAEWTFSPLGYRPSESGTIVPTYAPGLPLLMALFARTVGACGPFLVAPVCGALLVILAYALGARISGPVTGAMAALLTMTSPAVLYMSLWSMADVPAVVFWTAALLIAARWPSGMGAACAGAATGMAVLIRPNLVPLAIFPAVAVALSMTEGLRANRWRSVLWFALACLPFVLFIAWLNFDLYGSALHSGYGDTAALFRWEYARVNIAHYSRWLWQTQGPVVFLAGLAVVAPRGPRRDSTALRRLLLAFVAGVFCCYVFYTPFDAWWYLRFILPACPAIFVLAADVVWQGARRFGSLGRLGITLAITVMSVEYAITQTRTRAVLDTADGEQKYSDVGRFVSSQLPPTAMVFADLHSGSVRYYSGRTTIRYEWLDPEWLDRALTYLATSGFEPYLVLEKGEVARFRERFAGQVSVTLVDRPPLAVHSRQVFIYRARVPAGSEDPALPCCAAGHESSVAPIPVPHTTGCQ